ncbi:hypothetical protein LRAMOSA02210 [Lichtheimia ramosa]|uniref:Uncharacterized protein n=1 Tax=Lichtheimia ramosa TaxID=688394 RepID=A0A077WNB4_9FUNG|nr:hypothetical protein LRAMOSA02210 [Lichtheimia ramosa]
MNKNTLALPPRSSRRNRRVYCSSTTMTTTKLDKQYEARSYTEIMQTQNTRDRLALYERTFEMCMRADPQLTAWIKRMKQKGMPKPMLDGYTPPSHRRASEDSLPSSTFSSCSSISNSSVNDRKSFSSIFLRKASTGSSMPSAPPAPTQAPQVKPCSSASRFITTSLSRLSNLSTRRRSSTGSSHPSSNNNRTTMSSAPPPPTHGSQQNNAHLFVRRLRRSQDLRPKIAIQV